MFLFNAIDKALKKLGSSNSSLGSDEFAFASINPQENMSSLLSETPSKNSSLEVKKDTPVVEQKQSASVVEQKQATSVVQQKQGMPVKIIEQKDAYEGSYARVLLTAKEESKFFQGKAQLCRHQLAFNHSKDHVSYSSRLGDNYLDLYMPIKESNNKKELEESIKKTVSVFFKKAESQNESSINTEISFKNC